MLEEFKRDQLFVENKTGRPFVCAKSKSPRNKGKNFSYSLMFGEL